jgi:DNA-binding NarL/FixJ family response regulator
VRVFIVFRDTIYRRGLSAALEPAPEIESVEQATSIALAWEHEALASADVVLLDSDLGGAMSFVREVIGETDGRVVICLRDASATAALDALSSGVNGVLSYDQLTAEALLAAVRAVAEGVFVLDDGIIRVIAHSEQDETVESASGNADGRFTDREQTVLRLVAAGLSNREIAERLAYSERTIKTILHDVVTKLGVKSRSQAVAMAVRGRMI